MRIEWASYSTIGGTVVRHTIRKIIDGVTGDGLVGYYSDSLPAHCLRTSQKRPIVCLHIINMW